jgi:glycosyltransferase involved in cell wall biosynthesis
MLVYSFYESDNRVLRYAETLAQRGDRVDVIALRKGNQPYQSLLRGVNVFRIQERLKNEKNEFDYLFRLIKFIMRSFVLLTKNHIREPYQLIHVHNIPDFLVFAALIPKLMGAKVILDIHDIVPELYATKFQKAGKGLVLKALAFVERLSAAFSDHVIISNHIWQKRIIQRSVRKGKCSVIMNYPDERIFFRRQKKCNDGKFIMIYPGSLNRHQGLDLAIQAFSLIKDAMPQAEFHIYGSGGELENLRKFAESSNVKDWVSFKPPLSMDKIAEVMADADLGVVPKRDDAFGGEAFSTKIFEFMTLGVPVLVSATRIDRYYFNESVVRFFDPGSVVALASSMLELSRNPELCKKLSEKASDFIEGFCWSKKRRDYTDLVDRLLGYK